MTTVVAPKAKTRTDPLPPVEKLTRRAPSPPRNAVEGNLCDPMQVLTSQQRRAKYQDLDSLARDRRDARARSAAMKVS